MIAHHTLGGCPMRTGDLLGSGTISGEGSGKDYSGDDGQRSEAGLEEDGGYGSGFGWAMSAGPASDKGSLLEMSEGGSRDVMLYGMDVRKFLKDGDTVVMCGVCGPPGARVGFGECTGRIYSSER